MMRKAALFLFGFGLASFASGLVSGQEPQSSNGADKNGKSIASPDAPGSQPANPQTQTLGSNQDKEQGDPTMPSAEILRRIPQPSAPNAQDLLDSAKRLQEAGLTLQARERINQLEELENAPLEIRDEAAIWWASVAPDVVVPQNTPQPNQPIAKVKPAEALPKIPTMVIKALVMSSKDKGTVLLDVGGRQITIPLKPLDQQQRIPIPATQFVELGLAKTQVSSLQSGKKKKDQQDEEVEGFKVCPDCSFLNEGVVYNLESFSATTIVLRALPHNRLVLVRAANSP